MGRPSKAMLDKAKLQSRILQQFSDKATLNTERLCLGCHWFSGDICAKGLLPLTSKGEDCPYVCERTPEIT